MVRVPQQERSSATRSKVLDAAVECLLELGYAGTTTTLVADRAGVSRGAMQYHFRTKSELLAATVEHLVDRIGGEVREAAARLPADPGRDRFAAAIDLLWATSSAPLAITWLELNVAARTDEELQTLLESVRQRLTTMIRDASFALFGADRDNVAVGLFIEMNLAMLSGLMTARLTGIGGRRSRAKREAEVLGAWKAAAPVLLAELGVAAS